MKQKEKLALLTGFGLVMALIALLWATSMLEKKDRFSLKNSTPEVKVTHTVNVGADVQNVTMRKWSTYSDEKYRYALKYPENWLLDTTDGTSFYVKQFLTPAGKHPVIGNAITENLKDVTGDYFINISTYPRSDKSLTLEEWKGRARENSPQYLIDGQSVIKSVFESHEEKSGTINYYFINSKTQERYEITIWYKDKSNGIGDKMISTLDFSE